MDDSKMAFMLARLLADQGRYDPEKARKAYLFWLMIVTSNLGHHN
jgi:hypothetical protein